MPDFNADSIKYSPSRVIWVENGSGMYLDVKDARAENHTLIQLGGPGEQTNRRWRLIRVEHDQYMIVTVLNQSFVLYAQESDD